MSSPTSRVARICIGDDVGMINTPRQGRRVCRRATREPESSRSPARSDKRRRQALTTYLLLAASRRRARRRAGAEAEPMPATDDGDGDWR